MKALFNIGLFLATWFAIYMAFGEYWHYLDPEEPLPDQVLFAFFIVGFIFTMFLSAIYTVTRWFLFRRVKS